MATNLFTKAKKTAVKATPAKEDKKPRITITDPEFFKKIEKMEDLQASIKSSEGKLTMISDEIRDLGREKWAELYTEMGRNPGSVMLEGKNGEDIGQIMILPSDKYITINADRAESLKEMYGDEIVEESTTFAFDNEMIEKYGEVLSSLIENSDDIAEADKSKIVKAVVKLNVAKGTIDKLSKYGNVLKVMEDVRPVVALKGAEVIKG